MIVTNEVLKSRTQSVQKIKYLIFKYFNDFNFSRYSIYEFFDKVRKIPYQKDTKYLERVGRPLRILSLSGLDCKKKAVLMGSYAMQKNIKFRFVCSSVRPDKKIQHIFLQFLINGKWLNADATYKHLKFGQPKILTNYEIYEGN